MDDISEVFQEIRDDRLGAIAAEITTASPIDAALEQAWMKKLTEMTGRKVRLTKKVNPAILGGAVARIGSKVYDGSLKSRLAELREQLLAS
jgi:F-type H+-transporting ATPase subunit delta